MSSYRPNATSRARPSKANRAKALTRLAALLVLVAPLAAGCSDVKIDAVVKNIFRPKLTPQQYMLVAVSDSDPDLRREGVAEVAKSKEFDREWAIKGYIAIALLESDPQARCVAIRALARTRDPRAVETVLKILNYREHPPGQVRPPDELCRWDATLALAELCEAHVTPESSLDKARDTLLDRLAHDTHRHVRIAAARGLAYHQSDASVRGLIAGLRDADFTAVHQCEESLIRLTGVTHNCSAIKWEDWLAANGSELFARAGQIPESRRPPYTNGWGKFTYGVKQLLRRAVPGSKE